MTCTCQNEAHSPTVASTLVRDATVTAATLATRPMSEPFPVPEYPPAAWFTAPDWVPDWRAEHGLEVGVNAATGEDMSHHLTVTDEGRVGGYFFQRGICLVEGKDECWQPPPSPTGYALFHQQDVVTAEGALLKVGVIGNVHGHASPFDGPAQAQQHYADPSAQLIICRAGDDEIGGWVAGAMIPNATAADVALVRRCALSGDWRPMAPEWFKAAGVKPLDPVGYDCVGPTLVNRPGLPLIQKFPRAASAPVYLGGMGGVQLDQEVPPMYVQQADGSTVELTSEELGQAVTSYLEARQAAEEAPIPEGPETAAVDVEALAAQVTDQEARLQSLEEIVSEMISAEVAAIDAAVVPLPPEREDSPALA